MWGEGMMLQVLKNEKFLKYFRIFVAVALVLYFICGTLIGLFYLVVFLDPDGKLTVLQGILHGIKGLFTDPPAIAFVAYIFAIFSYSKEQFIKRVIQISLIMLVIFFIIVMDFFHIIFAEAIGIGSIYIFYASTFWGLVGLCLPKQCFLNPQPTRITQALRIIFYFIFVLTYFVSVYFIYF